MTTKAAERVTFVLRNQWANPNARDEAMDLVKALEAERQQAIDALREANDHVLAYKMRVGSVTDAEELQARCEQAIDALREIAKSEISPSVDVYSIQAFGFVREIARAALLNLGEQP